jgi:diketogulonate reductase-like aldo/keto reductase
VLPYCRAAGLGTLIWSPLAGGFLTGKYTREDPAGEGGRRAAFSVPPVELPRGYDAIDAVREIAQHHDVSSAHVAYAWLLAKPEVSTVIVGASTPEQLLDNLAASELSLTEKELGQLDALDTPGAAVPRSAVADRHGVIARARTRRHSRGASVGADSTPETSRAVMIRPRNDVPLVVIISSSGASVWRATV